MPIQIAPANQYLDDYKHFTDNQPIQDDGQIDSCATSKDWDIN